MQGYPGGSVVGFAPDQKGRPLFSFSSMSSHTQESVPKATFSRLSMIFTSHGTRKTPFGSTSKTTGQYFVSPQVGDCRVQLWCNHVV